MFLSWKFHNPGFLFHVEDSGRLAMSKFGSDSWQRYRCTIIDYMKNPMLRSLIVANRKTCQFGSYLFGRCQLLCLLHANVTTISYKAVLRVQVNLNRIATVGACVPTFFNGFEQTRLAEEHFKHMRLVGVDHFHAYILNSLVTFEHNQWAKHEANFTQTPPRIQGVEWTYIDSFLPEERCASNCCSLFRRVISVLLVPFLMDGIFCRFMYSETTHQAHCLFLHRHEYAFITFWDIDEFVIINEPWKDLPTLLQGFIGLNNIHAALTFMRYVYQDGCNTSVQLNRAWHERFIARHVLSETDRLNELYKVDLPSKQGDKVVVQPLMADDFYHHWLRSSRHGFTADPINVPEAKAFLKHIRRYEGNNVNCEQMAF